MSRIEVWAVDESSVERITESPRSWGVYLGLGVAWVLLSVLMMSYHVATLVTLAVFTGIAFVAGGITEMVDGFRTESGSRWLPVTFGVLSIGLGVVLLSWPRPTLYVIAVLVGWYLVVMGTVHFVVALFHTHRRYWWSLLVLGLVELLLGAWAASYPGRSLTVFATLVGVYALVHGIIEIFAAFIVRGLDRDLRVAATLNEPSTPAR